MVSIVEKQLLLTFGTTMTSSFLIFCISCRSYIFSDDFSVQPITQMNGCKQLRSTIFGGNWHLVFNNWALIALVWLEQALSCTLSVFISANWLTKIACASVGKLLRFFTRRIFRGLSQRSPDPRFSNLGMFIGKQNCCIKSEHPERSILALALALVIYPVHRAKWSNFMEFNRCLCPPPPPFLQTGIRMDKRWNRCPPPPPPPPPPKGCIIFIINIQSSLPLCK